MWYGGWPSETRSRLTTVCTVSSEWASRSSCMASSTLLTVPVKVTTPPSTSTLTPLLNRGWAACCSPSSVFVHHSFSSLSSFAIFSPVLSPLMAQEACQLLDLLLQRAISWRISNDGSAPRCQVRGRLVSRKPWTYTHKCGGEITDEQVRHS